MKMIHLPSLGPRYWTGLCVASILGANMGDFFADNLGLGNLKGLPFLAIVFVITFIAERCDKMRHEIYYWSAIIIVRMAATNFADFTTADLQLRRIIPMLTMILAGAIWLSLRLGWQGRLGKSEKVLRANCGYWFCMFLAGTLGTQISDHLSHDLGYGGTSLLLSSLVSFLFVIGRNGLLLIIPPYWATVVTIRAAGTAVGDYLAIPEQLGLPLSMALTGTVFVTLLSLWNDSRRDEAPVGVARCKSSDSSRERLE